MYSNCNADADVSTEIAICDKMASEEIGIGGKTERNNPLPPAAPKGNQNISAENLNVGDSDIDVNIPINKNSNDKTFAVIIANENYRREAQVIFAKNDGETFGKYCIQTLGLPEKNVHIVNVRQQSIIVNSKIQTPTVTASASIGDKWQGMKLK